MATTTDAIQIHKLAREIQYTRTSTLVHTHTQHFQFQFVVPGLALCLCALFVCSWGIKHAETANEMLLPVCSYLCNALHSPALARTHCGVRSCCCYSGCTEGGMCMCVCLRLRLNLKTSFFSCYSSSSSSDCGSGAAVLQWSVNEPYGGPNIILMLPG